MLHQKLNNFFLPQYFHDLKLNFDEEIRELRNRAREEELKKHQQIMRSHEQKLKVLEEGKEMLARKNQELQRLVQ